MTLSLMILVIPTGLAISSCKTFYLDDGWRNPAMKRFGLLLDENRQRQQDECEARLKF
jgi:hypothetical protein